MSTRRRSTVHDLASLRLHPDGSRVQASAVTGNRCEFSQGSDGIVQPTRLPRNTGRDKQENLIALDAGGTASIKKRRRTKILRIDDTEGRHAGTGKDRSESPEAADTHVDPRESSHWRQGPRSPSVSDENEGDGDEVQNVKDYRTKKRRKFYHDFSFLHAPPSASSPVLAISERTASSEAVSPSQNVTGNDATCFQQELPIPSSDLLKFIHYFSSEFYAARGCLFNAPKEARRATKLRKLAKLRKDVAKKSGQIVFDEEAGLEAELSDRRGNKSDGRDNGIGDGAEPMGDHGVEGERTGRQHKRSGKRRKKRSQTKPRRDMYKAFDGSALMAIGMLLQEHVAEMLGARAPEDWLQQMEALGTLQASGVEQKKRNRTEMKVDGDEAGENAGSGAASVSSQTANSDEEESDTDGNDSISSTGSSSESSSDE